MDDAEFARQKQRIDDLAKKWINPLGLGWWDIQFGHERDRFEVDGKPAPETLGQCRANWRYGHAYVEFNMPRVQNQTDDELERAFVHELMHIFLSETRESGDDWLDHEERVASCLTKAFLWLRDSLAETIAKPVISDEHANGLMVVTV